MPQASRNTEEHMSG